MPSRNWPVAAAIPVISALLQSAAFAASPDAWSVFRKDVEVACLAAAVPLVNQPQIVVDPFGSESYGLAFINGVAVEGASTRSLVCIYDKVAKTAEIGGTMALEQAVPSLQPDLKAEGRVDVEGDGTAPPAGDVNAAGPQAVSPPVAAAAVPAPEQGIPPAVTEPPLVPSPALQTATTGTAEPSAAVAALSDRFLSPSAEPAVNALPAEASALAPPAAAAPPAPAITPPNAAPAPVETAAVAASAPATPGSPAAPGTPGFAGQCDATCEVTLSGLGEPDRQELLALAAEVKRTIDKNAAASLGEGAAKARDTALAAAASVEGERLGAVSVPVAALAGERSCVLYYYGYSGEASRTVGRHRCAVSAGEGGSLVVEKISGERLRAEVQPLTAEVAAFVGRTYQSGQSETRYDAANPVSPANAELGNTVGFAAVSEGQLALVSSQRRRFEGTEDFFWVLAVDPK